MILRRLAGLLVIALSCHAALAEENKGVKKKANRLVAEKSPYLLQHAYNPVDWYPWGEEAFKKAKAEKKLILLSVGYSTCHWCHVMERESFEDETIAKFLNDNFIAVKLDREERPDVDQIYMTAFQALTQESGGWPLNIFLTADLKPLTGGTYFPPTDRGGRPGFLTVLKQINKAWKEQPETVTEQAGQIHEGLKKFFADAETPEVGELSRELISLSTAKMAAMFDPKWGGMGKTMKFPQVNVFRSVLQTGSAKEQEEVLKTCRHMIDGGIHDQVMGGFHRYAADRKWLVPHFEKMLYDQAQLLELFLDAWQKTRDPAFRKAAEGVINYVLRDLRHPEGGFYCAQDAQSEGKEGKCFCWTEAELQTLLSEEEMKVAREVLGVSTKGNFIDHSDPEPLQDQNILSFVKKRASLEESEEKAVQSIFAKLTKVRLKRVPPATDDKVLASWNGMMIGALARAGRVLGDERSLKAARQAHDFVKAKLWDEKSGKLYHRWRAGERDSSLQAESYLLLLRGTRQLYEAELRAEDLAFALKLAEGAMTLFYDKKDGGFFQGEMRPDLVLRLKGQFDGAIPTESSVAVREFAILSEITGRANLREVAKKTLRSYQKLIRESPSGMGEMLRSMDFFLAKPPRLVVAKGEGLDEMLAVAAKEFSPRLLLIGTEGAVSDFNRNLKAFDGKATAYYCVGQTCQLPVNSSAKLTAMFTKLKMDALKKPIK